VNEVETQTQREEASEGTKKELKELVVEAERLKRLYGLCKSIYMFRLAYNLTVNKIAKLFNTTPNTVTACLSYVSRSSSKTLIPIPISSAPTVEEFRRFCKDDAYSVRCQLLESELFMYSVAREALPVVVFWDVFIFARTVHRVLFHEVYDYLKSISTIGGDGVSFKALIRAVKRGGKWYVGAGILAYTYILLDLAFAHKGFYGTQWDTKIRSAIKDLTGVDPLSKNVIRVLIPLSHFVISRLGEKLPEIEKAQEEVYMELTRKFTL